MFQEVDNIKFFRYPALSLFMLFLIDTVTKPVAPNYFCGFSTFDMRKNVFVDFEAFFFLKQGLDEIAFKATSN